MSEGRALLTEREREALAGDESGSYRYKTRTYLRNRLEKLERDAELLAEHEPELFDRLQAAVCDDVASVCRHVALPIPGRARGVAAAVVGHTGDIVAHGRHATSAAGERERDVTADPGEPQAGPPGDVLDAVDAADADDDTDALPGTVDRQDAAAAVATARAYIRDHGGATKQDLVKNVMPDHTLGYDVDAALAKVDSQGRYRGGWWRSVVKPGLEALDDVEKPSRGGSTWKSAGET
jgi:hypothetical protein